MYEQEQTYSSVDLLKFLIRNYKALIVMTLLGAITSIIISLVITPKFKSSVVIFPASTSSVSKALLTDMSRAPKDVLKFGEEEETEQLLQILQSDEIKASIIQKYDLLSHYQIDPDSKYKKTELLNEYMDNISVRKTEFQAIEIKVLDTDPEVAAAIANEIAALLDSVYNKIQKDRAFKALEIVHRVYKNQQEFVNKLEDSLSLVKNQGLYNSLLKQHDEEIKQLSLLKSKYNEAQVDAYNDLPHKYIVNPAQVSEKKAYPVRWLIVVLSTISTFVFAFFLLLLLEKIVSVRKELSISENQEDNLG
ncbi:MAG: Wzz/FepE/Etk N-terminal domain-containing protein [Bacteroidales bacterium]|nr:Wzz/FepE/Etk N-terminal domain-containing protein [Bacteroidales bacterium]